MLTQGMMFADRYEFIRLLGRGGFSEVWLAKDKLTNVQVAVKVYAPGMGLDEDGQQLFTQEFSMVFDMNHTNLLRPTHFAIWNRQPYLILPYCANGSTFKYINENRRMPEQECWQMIHDVAAGLAYLHEKTPPLVHQDIKPDNILINDEGNFMITDFGISSRVRSTIRNGQAQEQSGGTMAYMGPERFSAKPKPIMASDIWSMGAMMYELMTGMPPFGNHGGVLQKSGAEIPILEGDYSQELKDMVYSFLAKETWDRPTAKTIEEMTYNKLHGLPMTIKQGPVSQQPVQQPEPQPRISQPTISQRQIKQQGMELRQQPPYSGQTVVRRSQPVRPDTKKWYMIGGAAAAVVVLIIVCIAIFGGSSNNGSDPDIFDTTAQRYLNEGDSLMRVADQYMAAHLDDRYNEENGKVEDIYVSALRTYEKVLVQKSQLENPALGDLAATQQATAKSRLQNVYRELVRMAEEIGLPEYAQPLTDRAKAIETIIGSTDE